MVLWWLPWYYGGCHGIMVVAMVSEACVVQTAPASTCIRTHRPDTRNTKDLH